MNRKQAELLATVELDQLSLEQLQRHRVKLIDAWRESRADYGMEQAVSDGFYAPFYEYGGGYVPKNKFLTLNLSYLIQRATEREEFLFNEK